MWLASLGKERIDEVFDPEIAVNRAIDYYRNKGYSDMLKLLFGTSLLLSVILKLLEIVLLGIILNCPKMTSIDIYPSE